MCKEVRLRLHNGLRLDYDQLRVQVGFEHWDDCTRTDLTNGTEFFTVTYMDHTEAQPNATNTATSLSKFFVRNAGLIPRGLGLGIGCTYGGGLFELEIG